NRFNLGIRQIYTDDEDSLFWMEKFYGAKQDLEPHEITPVCDGHDQYFSRWHIFENRNKVLHACKLSFTQLARMQDFIPIFENMPSTEILIMTVADRSYLVWLEILLRSVKFFHPEKRIFVIGVNLSDAEIKSI